LDAENGLVVDEEGRALGRHDGYWRFTAGQRRGLGVSAQEPLYALRSDAATNTVVVGPRASLARTVLEVRGRMYVSAERVSATLRVDKIALTLPADDAFQRVAHLVLGGLASRHDLTVETLEELTLALDTVLERYGDAIDQVTVQMGIADGVITMDVGPFGEDEFRSEIES